MTVTFADTEFRVDFQIPTRIHSPARMFEGRTSDLADAIAENRARLECSFNAAVRHGISGIVEAPKHEGPCGYMALAECLSTYCDDEQVLALVLAALKSSDPGMVLHAQLLLSVVRGNYVEAFEEVGL